MRNLLIDLEYMNTFVTGGQNIEDSQLLPAMWVAQTLYIEPILGDSLSESIDSSLEASPVPSTYTTLIGLIRRSLGYYTMYEALDELNVRTKNAGVLAVNPTNTTQISDVQFDKKRAKALSTAEAFRAELIKHLEKNASFYGWVNINVKERKPNALSMFGNIGTENYCETKANSDSVWNMKTGNTFIGEKIIVKQTLDGISSNVNLTGYAALGQFRSTSKTGDIVKTISFGSGITETDLANGTFDIDDFTCDFDAGTYYFDVLLTKDTNAFTVCQRTIFVEQTVSNP